MVHSKNVTFDRRNLFAGVLLVLTSFATLLSETPEITAIIASIIIFAMGIFLTNYATKTVKEADNYIEADMETEENYEEKYDNE